MDDSKWERYAAFGGVAFVVLNVVGAILTGEPPATDDSAAKIAEYFADKEGALKAALWLGGLGSVGLVWWSGSLWRRMVRAEGGWPRLAVASLVGLVLGGAMFLSSSAVTAAAALRIDDIGEGSRFFWTLSIVMLAAAGFGIGAHLLATNAIALRSRMLPRWMVIVGGVGGVVFLVAAVIGSSTDGGGAAIVGLIGFVLWCVWILAVSYVMWRDPVGLTPSRLDGAM